MRKNKLTGAIPKAGRKKGTEEKYTVHLTITKKAKLILDKQLRMEKGKFVSGLIEGSEVNNLLKPDVSGQSEQLVCPSCGSQVIVSDERHNIKICGVCKEQWAN